MQAPILRYAYRSHVAELDVVWESQLTDEAITVGAEQPGAVWDRTREQYIRGCEATGEDAHLLFAPADDLAGINRQAVRGGGTRYPIDDDFIVARRRAHQAHGCAAPGAYWGRRRGSSRRLSARCAREQARDGKATELSFHGVRARERLW